MHSLCSIELSYDDLQLPGYYEETFKSDAHILLNKQTYRYDISLIQNDMQYHHRIVKA